MTHASLASFTTTLVLAIAAAIAARCDLATRRIPNPLTFGVAAFAAVAWATEGLVPFLVALLLYVTVLAAGCVPFSLGWMGGGDVKLLAAGAACAGFPNVFDFLLVTAIAGGILGIVSLARSGRFDRLVVSAAAVVRTADVRLLNGGNAKLPYGLAIAAGALYLLASEFAPWLRLVHV